MSGGTRQPASGGPAHETVCSCSPPGEAAMSRLIVANVATAVPMGAEVYQEQVASRAAGGLGPGWTVDRMVVRSMRSPLAGTHRLPLRVLGGAPRRPAPPAGPGV